MEHSMIFDMASCNGQSFYPKRKAFSLSIKCWICVCVYVYWNEVVEANNSCSSTVTLLLYVLVFMYFRLLKSLFWNQVNWEIEREWIVWNMCLLKIYCRDFRPLCMQILINYIHTHTLTSPYHNGLYLCTQK